MPAEPRFGAAARRHYSDAWLLMESRRTATADHLAGLAAECGLKEIVTRYCGGRLTTRGSPLAPDGTSIRLHIDRLWDELPATLSGRAAAHLVPLLSGGTPFADWHIEDRYGDGAHITRQAAEKHMKAAKEVIGILEDLIHRGLLP